ncbi:MAG: triose-phosphate isomerase [Candidatus Aenigmarchaeota archaeon]
MKPILLINLKTYEEGTGENALDIAKAADSLAGNDVEIVIAVQPADIRKISDSVKIPVFSQHVDPIVYGSNTGWTLPESVKTAGATGTLLNHSERQTDLETIRKSLARCKDIGLRTVVCAGTPEKAKEVASLKPDYIAIEPPELIGGDISVSKAKPEVITQSIEKVNSVENIPVLCGAGVKDKEDVKKAIELGAKGILVASGVAKSENPEEAIKDLLKGFG